MIGTVGKAMFGAVLGGAIAVGAAGSAEASLINGTNLTYTLDLSTPDRLPESHNFNLAIGSAFDGTFNVADGTVRIQIDVEDTFIQVVATNIFGGGLGTIAGTSMLTGLAWMDAGEFITGLSVVSDFSATSAGSIIGGGTGISLDFLEAPFREDEVHTTTIFFTTNAVPEPATLTLLGLGLAGLGAARRRKAA